VPGLFHFEQCLTFEPFGCILCLIEKPLKRRPDMAEEQLPDWLASLRGQQTSSEELPAEPPAAAEQPSPDWLADLRKQQLGAQPESQAAPPSLPEPPPGPAVRPDLLGDLREQIELPEEEARPRSSAGGLASLKPQQRFVLALLLFFEVALCGCVLLLLTERVWIR
jgi:hypothetical protein